MRETAERATAAVAIRPEPDDLGWALTTVLRAYVRATEVVLEDLPGGARAYRLLLGAAQERSSSQLALAESVGLDRTVVTYLLDGLVSEGLVERQADPNDRRTRRVVLTDHGAARMAEFAERLARVEQHVLGSLGDTDSATFRRLLDAAAHGVKGADPTSCRDVAAAAAPDGLDCTAEPGC